MWLIPRLVNIGIFFYNFGKEGNTEYIYMNFYILKVK